MTPAQMRALYELQFWKNVSHDAEQFAGMAAGIVPTPPEIQDRLERNYRLTFTCKSCPNEHTVTGPWKGMIEAMMALTARGIDEILVQEEASALLEDAETADETLVERGLDADINDRLNEQFFKRKP